MSQSKEHAKTFFMGDLIKGSGCVFMGLMFIFGYFSFCQLRGKDKFGSLRTKIKDQI